MIKKLLFIPLLFLCVNAFGATQVKRTVCPSGCDHSTLNDAVTYFETNYANFVTSDIYGTIEISGDWSGGPDTTRVNISGITTDATRFLEIYTTGNAVHSGSYSTDYYLLSTTGSSIESSIAYYRITGIQMKTSTASAATFYNSGTGIIYLDKIIAYSKGESFFNGGGSGTLNIYNSIGISDGDSGRPTFRKNSSNTTNIYNSVGINNGSGEAFREETTTNKMVLINVYGYSVSGTDIDSDCNTTTSASVDGSDSSTSVAYSTDTFKNITPSSEDFHLVVGSDLIGIGTDLSGTFTDDIDGDTRTTWDIGVDFMGGNKLYLNSRILVNENIKVGQ